MRRLLLALAAGVFLACSLADHLAVEKGPLSVVIVEETADRPGYTKDQLRWLSGLSFRDALKAKGHSFAQVDKDVRAPGQKTPPAELVPFLDAAKAKRLPALVIRTGSGKISVTEAVPSEAAAIAAVTKAGGR